MPPTSVERQGIPEKPGAPVLVLAPLVVGGVLDGSHVRAVGVRDDLVPEEGAVRVVGRAQGVHRRLHHRIREDRLVPNVERERLAHEAAHIHCAITLVRL